MNDLPMIKEKLAQGLSTLNLSPNVDELLQYLTLLDKWNQAYNLTGIRDLSSMVSRHLLDSLAISPWLQGPSIIDVGAGAGLPGLPLAILHKDLCVTLLDSNGKKIRFLKEVKRQLNLTNVNIVESRCENFHPKNPFQTVVSRAFTHLAQMIAWTQHLLQPKGLWLAMKGHYPREELKEITFPYQIKKYRIPGLNNDHCCVLIKKE